ncbi:hypothetical protein DOQ08_01717 [Marinobacter litoralis]|uniref:DUF4124 domain-containing protein n=1 Tax=Marinobacter litoralis TaxID=187981 RepID=A0A3M2RGG1_9GAMM|nr:DUF4124 domain-containing protein [Marinobacter litoralis]RMJ04396.1 hypothetical protein DOQ08_01717 [Marinobacter litoralis]
MRRIALMVLCMLVTVPAHAEIYRWTDARGSIHFSDTPPNLEGHAAITVREPVTVPLSVNIRQSEKVRQSRQSVERLLHSKSKKRYAKAAKDEQMKASQCAKYRAQLDRIQMQLRAGYSNDRGNNLRQKRRKVSQLYGNHCVLD